MPYFKTNSPLSQPKYNCGTSCSSPRLGMGFSSSPQLRLDSSFCRNKIINGERKIYVDSYERCAGKLTKTGKCNKGYIDVRGYYRVACGPLKLNNIYNDASDNELTKAIVEGKSLSDIRVIIDNAIDPANNNANEIVNHVNSMGQSALHHAALLKKTEIYDFLKTYGNEKLEDKCGFTPEYLKNQY